MEIKKKEYVNKGVDGVAKPSDSAMESGCMVSQYNMVTGQMEWKVQPADYDYHQEIARSAYADMLHDTERNQKYYSSIIKAVKQLQDRGRKVHVLDIGTGTGLLSMMAVAAGADSVTACEAFAPMGKCAENVMEANGYKDKIKLIHDRSTYVTVGEGSSSTLAQHANLLVTEVFDTELIGEDAIGTYTHAHQHLMEEDCLAVPMAANMYVQPVCSKFFRGWKDLPNIEVSLGEHIRIPSKYTQCGGSASLHDLQLSQVKENLFTPVSKPVKVFRFDFSKRGALKERNSSEVTIMSEVDGTVDAIFMWWDLEMDPDGEIILSCAPKWAHPDGEQQPWRDHWMQAAFYPPNRLPVSQGEEFRIKSYHDGFSLWFQTTAVNDCKQVDIIERPVCECGLHLAYSRPRLGMLNDESRNNVYLSTLKKCVNSSTVCLCVSDGTLLPFIAAKLGAQKVFTLQNGLCAKIIRSIAKENELEGKVVVIEQQGQVLTEQDFQGLKVDVVIGEPSFMCSSLPWDNMHYCYTVNTIRPLLSSNVLVLPATMTVHAMAMQFTDLWKIRAPVGMCEGFDISFFDNMIRSSSDIVDERVEPQPLWEYPGTAMSEPVEVLSLDFSKSTSNSRLSEILHHKLQCQMEGSVNGVALWCQFNFGEGQTISTGPRQTPIIGSVVEWDTFSRQAVYIPYTPSAVSPGSSLDFSVKFVSTEGSLNFTWDF